MPKITANFSKISSSTDQLHGEFRCTLFEIEAVKTQTSGLDQLIFKNRVREPEEHADREIWDYCVMETKEHKPSKMGLGRLKAYAEAIMGAEYANSLSGIDTDDLKNGDVTLICSKQSYKKSDEKGGGEGFKTQVDKILKPA